MVERASAQCHLVFAKLGLGVNGGGPLVRAGRPRPALSSKNQVLAKIEGPARGPAADQGRTRGSAPPIMHVCARGKTKRHWAEARLVVKCQCPEDRLGAPQSAWAQHGGMLFG